jgi:hypothetical protein
MRSGEFIQDFAGPVRQAPDSRNRCRIDDGRCRAGGGVPFNLSALPALATGCGRSHHKTTIAPHAMTAALTNA